MNEEFEMLCFMSVPDGYDICPACGHHTSAGKCTVLVKVQSHPDMINYCDCDCYKAMQIVRTVNSSKRVTHWKMGNFR